MKSLTKLVAVSVLVVMVVAPSTATATQESAKQPEQCNYSPTFSAACRFSNYQPAGHGSTHVLSGTITHNGLPVDDVSVFLTDSTTLEFVGPYGLSKSGAYDIAIEPGTYYVMVADRTGRFVSEFHDGAARYTESAAIAVTDDTTLNLAVRSPVGTISGTITDSNGDPVAGATVVAAATLNDFNLFHIAKSSFNLADTGADGTYTVKGLATADYFVIVLSGPGARWYGSDLMTSDPIADHATTVAVAEGANTPNIDVSSDFPPVGFVSGTVLGQSLKPLPGVCAQAVRTTDLGDIIKSDVTDYQGNFTLSDIALADTFYVRFVDCARDVYVSEWFSGIEGDNPGGATVYDGDDAEFIVATLNVRFTDIGSSIFVEDILWLAGEKITRGCNAARTEFCPNKPVTRGQMAALLVRALGLIEHDQNIDFADDDDSIFETDIEKLATAGITFGCGDGTRFCPDQVVTRGQMAAFLVRAYELTEIDPTISFTDDNNSIFETDILRLATAGITFGCGDGTTFCPGQAVTRGQMAALLRRAAAR